MRPFDLSRAPLLRVQLVTSSSENHLLLLDIHHIISDGTSMEILVADFTRIYNGEELPELKLQYKDFACWQNNLFESGKISGQEKYWLELYEDIGRGEIPEPALPTDYPRPEKQDFTGAGYEFELGMEETSAFKELAAENGATLFMNLLAAFTLLLHKYSDREDIIVGSGIAGRHHADLQDIVGFFVNSLAIRNYPRPHKSYEEFLKEVKNNCVKAFENQDFQFEELVGKLNLERDPSRNPLFDVIFTLQNYERRKIDTGGRLQFSVFDYEIETSQFDMSIDILDKGDTIIFSVIYATSLFKASTVEKIARHYIEVIRQIIGNKKIQLEDIELSHELRDAVPAIEEETESDFGF